MKRILVLLFVISLAACKDDDSPAAPTTISSVNLVSSNAFGGSQEDWSTATVKTADGGVVTVGWTLSSDGDVSTNNGDADFWVLKLDASGNKQWEKSFGGGNGEHGFAVAATPDGGYVVAGNTISIDGDVSNNYGGNDLWVLKLDASGNKQWAKTFGGLEHEGARGIIANSDGSYVITGNTNSTDGDFIDNHGSTDIWVLKLDNSGAIQWSKIFGGSGFDESHSLTATADGGYAITGYTESTDGDIESNLGGSDMWLLKLDASGTKQWSKTYGGSSSDEGGFITTTADGGYAITGASSSSDGDLSGINEDGENSAWIVKLDASGAVKWTKIFGGTSYSYASSLVTTASGQYIVAGYTKSNDGDMVGNHGGLDGFILALDASGNKLLLKMFGGSGDEELGPVTITTGGKYFVTGATRSNDGDVSGLHSGYDFWVMQLDFQ